MLIQIKTLTPWDGSRIDGTAYPANIEQLWSDADLAAIGLARFTPFVLPDGQVAVGQARYQLQPDGTIAEVFDTTSAPPVPPAAIPKSVVTARIIAAGKNAQGQSYIALAQAALLGNPAAFGKWIAADQPSVNASDPDATAMVKGIGLDPNVILAP